MPNVAILPTPRARAAVAATNVRNAGTSGIFDIAGRLGQAHRRPRYICDTIDALIAHEGFPAPYPLVRGGALVRSVHADSRWPTAAVDHWFDNQLPPGARAAIVSADRRDVDDRLSTNLAGLFGEGGAA